MAQVPLTVPREVKQKMREALGLGAPVHIQYLKWLNQFFIVEPQFLIDWMTRDSLLFGWLPDTQLGMVYDANWKNSSHSSATSAGRPVAQSWTS